MKFDDKILNEEILKAGYAWFYAQYCKSAFCSDWQQLEQKAKLIKTGLWSDVHARAPWDFRHGSNTETQQATTSSEEYHGNVDSLKFHKSDCRYFNCKNCTKIFNSKADAEKAGYVGCNVCNP